MYDAPTNVGEQVTFQPFVRSNVILDGPTKMLIRHFFKHRTSSKTFCRYIYLGVITSTAPCTSLYPVMEFLSLVCRSTRRVFSWFCACLISFNCWPRLSINDCCFSISSRPLLKNLAQKSFRFTVYSWYFWSF